MDLKTQIAPYITQYKNIKEYLLINNFDSIDDLKSEINSGDLIFISEFNGKNIVNKLLEMANQPELLQEIISVWDDDDYSNFKMHSDNWKLDYLLNCYSTGIIFIPTLGYYLAMDC